MELVSPALGGEGDLPSRLASIISSVAAGLDVELLKFVDSSERLRSAGHRQGRSISHTIDAYRGNRRQSTLHVGARAIDAEGVGLAALSIHVELVGIDAGDDSGR